VQPVVVVPVEVLSLVLEVLLPEAEPLLLLLQASMRTGTAVAPIKRLFKNLALVCSMVIVFYRNEEWKGRVACFFCFNRLVAVNGENPAVNPIV
jgi:hypothetical protein